VVNTCLKPSYHSRRLLASKEGILLATGLSKTVSQNELIGLWVKESLPCSQSLDFLPLSGVNASPIWSMYGISCLQLRFLALPLLKLSISKNLTSPTSEYGGALPMCISSKISAILFSLTTKNASLLDILLATRAGSSITQSLSAPLSPRELISTKGTFLGLLKRKSTLSAALLALLTLFPLLSPLQPHQQHILGCLLFQMKGVMLSPFLNVLHLLVRVLHMVISKRSHQSLLQVQNQCLIYQLLHLFFFFFFFFFFEWDYIFLNFKWGRINKKNLVSLVKEVRYVPEG
jgi:hypothetical protein